MDISDSCTCAILFNASTMPLCSLLLLLSLLLWSAWFEKAEMSAPLLLTLSGDSSTYTPVPLPSLSSSSDASSSTSTMSSTPSRLETTWKPHVWDYFMIAEDKKFAKCNDSQDLVSSGGDNWKNFNTTNLVHHLISSPKYLYTMIFVNLRKETSNEKKLEKGDCK